MNLNMKKGNGFTLVELMITVAIVGILAAIAMPAYNNYVMRAELSEALSLMASVKMEIEERYAGGEPLDLLMEDGATQLRTARPTGKYAKVYNTQFGSIMTLMRDPKFHNTWVVMQPEENGKGGLVWTCGGWYSDMRYFPSSCSHVFTF